MSDKKYFVICNPASRSGKGRKLCERTIAILKQKNVPFECAWTQKPIDAINLAATAAQQQWETVVAVGGDGTICEVISGLLKDNPLASNPKLGVIHVGTSPDFNKYHNIPTKIEEAIDVLLKGNSERIDIGKITYCLTDNQEKDAVSYFASNVNVGLGPLIAARANSRYRKYLGDTCGTLFALLRSLIGFKKMTITLSAEGKNTDAGKLINLTIGKDPYLASGMRVLHNITADDGMLYLLAIQQTSFLCLLRAIPKLYNGNILEYSGAHIANIQRAEIDRCSNYPRVEFDGDVKGYLPATIEVLPKGLEVII
ncbi:diacylglycerol/lipid kinase family protein [Candidatus Omnitrophota bacterium]